MCCSSLQSVSVHLPRSVAISEHAKQVIFLLLACPVFGHPPPDTVIFFISGSALKCGLPLPLPTLFHSQGLVLPSAYRCLEPLPSADRCSESSQSGGIGYPHKNNLHYQHFHLDRMPPIFFRQQTLSRATHF
jgi:hypothetical protein